MNSFPRGESGPSAVLTRFAPTPSGYLHLGNLFSFCLTWLSAKKRGGKVLLRIDDLDAPRFRDEYLRDIFATLSWAGLCYDLGPRDEADFHRNFRQALRLPLYEKTLDALAAEDRVFACACSRKKLQEAASASAAAYPGFCREAGLPMDAPETALRVKTATGFIVRRRDGLPAYHLASVVDDAFFGVRLVVRGADLLSSTLAQKELALLLQGSSDSFARGIGEVFSGAEVLHHGLWVGEDGEKLSKSKGARSLASLRDRLPGPEPLFGLFRQALAGGEPHPLSLSEWLSTFDAEKIPTEPLPVRGALERLGLE